MFKNILNLQNHSSLIYHYLRNVNRNTPVFPTKQATMSWCTRSEVRLLHFSLQQLSLRKQSKRKQIRGNRETAPFSDSASCTYFMSVPGSTMLTFPPIRSASLWDAFVDPPRVPGAELCGSTLLLTGRHFQPESTSTNCLPQAQPGHCCPFQQHYPGEMLSVSTLGFRPFPGRNDSKITQTPHSFSQPNAAPTPWLQRYFQITEMLKTEDLKPVVRWDLNLSHALQSLVKHQLPFWKPALCNKSKTHCKLV